MPTDTNGDCIVDVADLSQVITAWGQTCASVGATPPGDVNGDCAVGLEDLGLVIVQWGRTCAN